MKSTFILDGLDCASCAAKMEEQIKKIEGVNEVSISFISQKLVIDYIEERKEEILKDMKKIIKKLEPDIELREI